MKKRILFSIIGLFLLSFILIANESKTETVKPQGKYDGPGLYVYVSGSGEETASVRGRNISTGVDYYATNLGKGQYKLEYIPSGTYNIYVCGNNNHGSELGVVFNFPSGPASNISLSGTGCPWGND